MSESDAVSRLVVVGASAGGIEALSILLSNLPASFPAPLVIAQHLDPSHISHLREVLERASKLPVHTVTDAEELRNGVVYVVPPNRDIEIQDRTVRLSRSAGERPKPLINLLFSSAAEAFGEELIAVILTGTGSDGADGARIVKEHGGTVIIQNPQTASHPGMPLSLAPTTVDIVSDLPAIGPLLDDILTGSYTPPPAEEDRQMRALLEQLRQQSGIDFSQYRQTTIQRRLLRRLADTGTSDIDAYLRYLRRHPEEYNRLVSTFLIKVTDFFRDTELFDYLRESLLPELIESARGHDGELRIWSAGCATDEEAYSVAVLLADLLGDDLERLNVRIFATDADPDAISFARRGVYPASSLKNMTVAMRDRLFTPLDGAFEIHKRIRSLLLFGQHDLGQRAPFPRTDLVLCRNVLIYFTPDLQRRALQLFAFSLRPGGRLILGKSESTSPLSEYFNLENPPLRVYRRQGERILIPNTNPTGPLSAPEQAIRARSTQLAAERELARAHQSQRQARGPAERSDAALLNLPVGVAIINRSYDVLSINMAARRLLGIHTSGIGDDFVHLTRSVPAESLRKLIDRALEGVDSRDTFAVRSIGASADNERQLEIRCVRQPTQQEDDPEMVLVTITDLTVLIAEQERLRSDGDHRSAEIARLTTQLSESQDEVVQLLSANEQLNNSNAILRSQNEDLLLNAEEAQASAEEIETLSEEQQASNEELETLNEELQATVEELNTANEDLNARSSELQSAATSQQTERLRLAAILASMADAAFAVDSGGRPVFANAPFERLFGADAGGLRPEDEEGRPLPPETTPQRRAARGEQFTLEFGITATDGNKHWFEARGEPVLGPGPEAGVVIIRDITERRLRMLEERFIVMVAHELRTPITVLQGSVQALARLQEPNLSAQGRSYVAIATQGIERLAALTNELVDVERLRTGRMEMNQLPIDLRDVIRRCVEASKTLGKRVVLTAPRSAIMVNGDRLRLEQVYMNLITNAVTHAPDSEQVDVRLRAEAEEAIVEVRDYGPGIPADELRNVFTLFYRGRPSRDERAKGLGLGLFICREILVAHSGSIEVQSVEGRGATFTTRLPLLSATNQSRRRPASSD
jgi:two-component system CheB/CheR fusion protein